MNSTKMAQRLLGVLFVEVIFEFLGINILKGINESNNLFFLFFDKCLFLILLIILNAKLTRQKIPFSLKLNKEQRNLVLTLITALIIIGVMNEKNFLAAFTIGLIASTTEEYLFRGIILVTLLRLFWRSTKQSTRILFPAIISSVLFGLEHFLNLYSQNFSLTTIQVCQTMAMGFLFASLFIRTKNLLFPIICHFGIDFVVTAFWGVQNTNNASFGGAVSVAILYIMIGFIILRV
ncbi:MAG: CPBP family intramembrane glutamic endopeptidase [Liquorilactobacillus satsumensis]|uniref:CPBP family intramembrane glutamic endopeptidase n=4 Tax=Liquorilactobacillus satsumensis TaxID=259059 RepID=UPI000704E002